MAHDIVGADLTQLDELSIAFQTAGAEISAKASVLDGKIQAAISAFDGTLSSLQSEAGALARSIDDEMNALAGQAGGVQWTGANRTAFDGDMTQFTSVVAAGTARIDTDIAAIKGQVDAGFTPVLAEFGAALKKSGDDVDAATAQMQTAVSSQRANLDQAANVGWSNA